MRKLDQSNLSKNYRYQQYRPAWEKESWAQGWLSRSPLDTSKAFCNYCQKQLVPGKSELSSHTRSAKHLRRSKAMQKACTCKTECAIHHITGKCKEELIIASSLQQSDHEFYKFKTGLPEIENQSGPNVVAEAMETAVHTNHINHIIHASQPVSEIGFTEDLWDDSLQVERAMAVEGLASLSGNEVHINSDQSSSSQHAQIVIIAPPAIGPTNHEELTSTIKITPQSCSATTTPAVVYCNEKPILSTTNNVIPNQQSSIASFMHNYSCPVSQLQQQQHENTNMNTASPSIGQVVTNNNCCCKCQVHGSHWEKYMAEKTELKRLEQQRVREELKTQKLIQQYHRLKIKKLHQSENSGQKVSESVSKPGNG